MVERKIKMPIHSQPLNVKNCFELHVYKWHATYYWKALDEGYNIASHLTLIKGQHNKLWAQKWRKSKFQEFQDLQCGSFEIK
jgi:hypothetical protein